MARMIENTARSFSTFADMHKDAYGFRPMAYASREFDALSETAKVAEMDRLQAMIVENIDNERAAEIRAAERFETRIAGMMADFNITRETAIRWDIQALDVAEEVENYGMWYYCIENGLAQSYFEGTGK